MFVCLFGEHHPFTESPLSIIILTTMGRRSSDSFIVDILCCISVFLFCIVFTVLLAVWHRDTKHATTNLHQGVVETEVSPNGQHTNTTPKISESTTRQPLVTEDHIFIDNNRVEVINTIKPFSIPDVDLRDRGGRGHRGPPSNPQPPTGNSTISHHEITPPTTTNHTWGGRPH